MVITGGSVIRGMRVPSRFSLWVHEFRENLDFAASNLRFHSDSLGWCTTVRVETWCIYAFVYVCAGFCWRLEMIKLNGAVYFIVSKLKNLVDPYIIYIWFSTILHLVTSLFFFLYFPIFSIQRFENREIFFFSKFISKNEVSRKSSGERNLPGSESFFINSTSRGSRRVFHN